MVTPIGALPAKLDALAGAIRDGRKATVTDMSLVAKDEFLAGPPRSGLPRNSSLKWGAGYTTKGVSNPTSLVSYRGPVHWTNNGTDPHVITPKGFVGSRAARTARARTFDIATRSTGNRLSGRKVAGGAARAVLAHGKGSPKHWRRVAYHPGQKARPFWPGVQRRTTARAEAVLKSGLARNMTRAGFDAARNLR